MTPRVRPRQEAHRPSSGLAVSQSGIAQPDMSWGSPTHPLSILSRQHTHVGYDFVPILREDVEGDLWRTARGAVGGHS